MSISSVDIGNQKTSPKNLEANKRGILPLQVWPWIAAKRRTYPPWGVIHSQKRLSRDAIPQQHFRTKKYNYPLTYW